MASASVHKSPETGKFVVVGKDNEILHTFDSEGEANLQVLSIEQAEKEAKQEAKAEAKAHKNDDDEGKSHARSESSAGGRHR